MTDKTAAEKLGLSPAEKCVFLNVGKPMPAPSQNLLAEGKLESRFDLFTETISAMHAKTPTFFAICAPPYLFYSRKRKSVPLFILVCSSFVSREVLSTLFSRSMKTEY